MSDFVKDILLQMQEEQVEQGKALARIEAGFETRVAKLETSQDRQWWMTYVITPALVLGHAVARKLGVVNV